MYARYVNLIMMLIDIPRSSYMRRVKRLKEFFLTEKNGPMGSMYKGEIDTQRRINTHRITSTPMKPPKHFVDYTSHVS